MVVVRSTSQAQIALTLLSQRSPAESSKLTKAAPGPEPVSFRGVAISPGVSDALLKISELAQTAEARQAEAQSAFHAAEVAQDYSVEYRGSGPVAVPPEVAAARRRLNESFELPSLEIPEKGLVRLPHHHKQVDEDEFEAEVHDSVVEFAYTTDSESLRRALEDGTVKIYRPADLPEADYHSNLYDRYVDGHFYGSETIGSGSVRFGQYALAQAAKGIGVIVGDVPGGEFVVTFSDPTLKDRFATSTDPAP